jgi:hypothetical protein
MTIRQSFNRKRSIIFLIFLAGILLQIILFQTVILKTTGPTPLYLFSGAIIAFVAGLCNYFAIRCPLCKGNIGLVFWYSGGILYISKKIRYCPYCGSSIDEETENKLFQK